MIYRILSNDMPRRNYPKKATKTLHLASTTLDVAYTPYIACRTKRRFANEVVAKREAETRELINYDLKLNVYRCQYCQGWHLTRQKNSF